MPDTLAEYFAEIHAAEDRWYAEHCQHTRLLGSSFWYDHEELLREIDQRHGIRPDDPRVYSIAAFKAEQQKLQEDWQRLCTEHGWQNPTPGSPDHPAFFDARARHWARRDDLIARHRRFGRLREGGRGFGLLTDLLVQPARWARYLLNTVDANI